MTFRMVIETWLEDDRVKEEHEQKRLDTFWNSLCAHNSYVFMPSAHIIRTYLVFMCVNGWCLEDEKRGVSLPLRVWGDG